MVHPTPLTPPEPEATPRAGRAVLISTVITAVLGVLATLGYYKATEPACPPCPCAVTAPAPAPAE